MPLHSSKGGHSGAPSRTATRMVRPPIRRIRIRSAGPGRRSRLRTPPRPDAGRSSPAGPGRDASMVIDVGSRRVADRRQPAAAGLAGGGLLLPAALGQPARVVRPPGAATGLRVPEPPLRILRGVLGHLVAGLVVSGRID